MANETTHSKHVLVIDGGGMRGLGCLMVVDAIMEELSMRNGVRLLPCEVFDLICGTSVGGLLSILLGRLGLDCKTAINIYEKAASALFKKDKDIWDIIANSHLIDSSTFDRYIADRVREIAGSSDISMKTAIHDGQDPKPHPSAETFVTVMEDAPDYPSRTHIISSYKRENTSPTISRNWTIPEVTRAIIASPIYIPPLSILTDKIRSFQDAGFCGYNNPTELAASEWKKILPNGRIGTVISLGTGLQDFLPETPLVSREWGPIPQYVRSLSNKVFRERIPYLHKYDEVELNVAYAIRQLARIAADSRIIHQEFDRKHVSRCEHYHRIDESFGLNQLDLVDVYKADLIKSRFDDWLNGKGKLYIDKIASTITVKVSLPKTKEEAVASAPPPPPRETVKGYNPVLDQPRPTTIDDYLRKYEVMFVIDDSGSMTGTRWTETRDALREIAQHALELKVHTVSLRFFNNPTFVRGLQGADAVMKLFDSVIPSGGTPTGEVMRAVFKDHLDTIDKTIAKQELYKVPPLDIIVLTDGDPSDDPAAVIADAVKRVKGSKYHPNIMGVQFVQIGHEEDAIEALKKLVMGDNGSIVDTVPYRGVLTPEKLQRILLGGMHPNVRAMLPVELLANQF
ncbi:hypothetical protein AX15_003140 [Amanita polypyramis BW_CC]|nr:hypothetical protein AX15_003140 [Amanita polypyramis BW_CC]